MQTPIRTGREDQTRRWIDMSSVYDHVESSDSDIDPGISVHGSGSKDSNGSSSLVGNDAEDFNAIRCEREKVNQLVTECFRERREKEELIKEVEKLQQEKILVQQEKILAQQELMTLKSKLEMYEASSGSMKEVEDQWLKRDTEMAKARALADTRQKTIKSLRAVLGRRNAAANQQRVAPAEYTEIESCKLPAKGYDVAEAIMSSETIARGARFQDVTEVPNGKKRKWRHTKIAMDAVIPEFPGPFIGRQKEGIYIGGIIANPEALKAAMILWSETNLSVNALSKLAAQNEQAQRRVFVCAHRHIGNNETIRRSFPGSEEKPLDVFGNYCRGTLTESIHSFQMATDRVISAKISRAHVVHLAVDISTFTIYHMQSMYMALLFIEQVGVDACGHPIWGVNRDDGFLPAIPVGEKMTRQLSDENGNNFCASTPQAAALSLFLGDALSLLGHDCLSVGVDDGGEGAGINDDSTEGDDRAIKNGDGSYRKDMFGNRSAFQQAYNKHSELLDNWMDFNNVEAEARELAKERTMPKTLNPIESFDTCERILLIRKRDPSYTPDRPVWTAETETERLLPRPSTNFNPMKSVALVLGGVPNFFLCFKHLVQTVMLHSSKAVMPFYRELASVILAINNVWILTRIITNLAKIFELEDCGARSAMHIDVAEGLKAINPKLFEEVRARYITAKGYSRLIEACVTRWGAVGEGGSQLAVRFPEYPVIVLFSFAEGLDRSIVQAAVSIWHVDGFRHDNMIHLPPKPGKLLYRLMDPGFIFGTHMTAFFDKFVHRIVLGASSYNKESSAHLIGGVGSAVRRVYHFLTRLMWVVLPVKEKYTKFSARQKQHLTDKKLPLMFAMLQSAPGILFKSSKGGKNPWNMFYQLQWKGLVKANLGPGLLMLNSSATRSAAGGGTSALQHCYGPCFRQDMEGGIEEFCNIIHKLSLQKFDDQRNFLPKGTIRTMCSGPQNLPYERRKVMLKAVFLQATAAAVAIKNKFESTLSDPHLWLAGVSLMDEVPVTLKNGKTSSYFVANRDSLANAACLEGLMDEMEQKYAPQLGLGEKLGEYFHGPLRDLLLSPACRQQLIDFRKANSVNFARNVLGETGSYKIGEDHKNGRFKFRPMPVSAFSLLTELSLKCAAMPRTQNRIEGGFSLDSIAFRSNRRNQGPEMWSAILRKMNYRSFHLKKDVAQEFFNQNFDDCTQFRRNNRNGLRKCYFPDNDQTQAKYHARMRSDLPQYVERGEAYRGKSNICDGTDSSKALQSRNRNAGQKENSRFRDCEPDEALGEGESSRPKQKRSQKKKKMANPSLEAPSEWTLDSLNELPVADLKDMCSIQEITVVRDGTRSLTKRDYIAAILEDQSRQREISHEQFSEPEAIQLESSNSQDLTEADDIPIAEADNSQADVTNHSDLGHDDQAAIACGHSGNASLESPDPESNDEEIDESTLALLEGNMACPPPIDEARALVTCGVSGDASLESPDPASNDEFDENLGYILDCLEKGIEPYSEQPNSEALKQFDRDMSAPAADTDFLSESDSEDQASSGTDAPLQDSEDQAPSRTDAPLPEGLPALPKKTPSAWKREFTANMARERSWRPSNIISTCAYTYRSKPDCCHGEPIKSVILQRADGQQFTVKDSGCLFYLLRTPLAGIELVKVSAIYHPKDVSKGGQMQVFIEYCRVLKGSEAALVCDRADDLTRLIKSNDGHSFISTSVGSKQIELQLRERREQKKEELYHWGDVFFQANAANLVGAVYWVSTGNESDRAKCPSFQNDVLRGIKDKIPVTNLKALDYVVVGSSFSDSRLCGFP